MNQGVTAILVMMSVVKYYPAPERYHDAISSAGNAAAIQSGEAEFEQKAAQVAEQKARHIVYSVGVPDKAVIGALVIAKVARERQIVLRGPRMVSAETQFTVALGSGILGLTWRF